jgi:alkylation response protein AidB-like acyl-CoA dehydrogenase
MWCDQMMMLVRTDPDAPKHRGLSALITPMNVPGLTVRPIKQINGAVEFAEVFFDDVFVPPENLIGGLGDGWRVALATLRHERITATRAFEAARMVSDLIADTQPSDDPLVRFEVARLYAETLAARVSYLRMIERQQRTGDTGGIENAGKLHVNELVQRIAELGSGVCGPDLPRSPVVLREGVPDWSFDFLKTRRYTIGGGTSQILRNIVGERVLGLPR